MRKSEIFEAIIAIVSDTTDITKGQIISKCRCSDVVDARHIAVYFCHHAGLSASAISEHIHLCRRAIEKAIDQFEDRRKFSHPIFGVYCEKVAKELRTRLEIIC